MVNNKSVFSQIIIPVAITLSYAFVYLPILVMIVFSFNAASNPHSWTGFSLEWYKKVLTSPDAISSLYTSLIVATISTFLSVFLSACLVISSKWWQPNFLWVIFFQSLIAPEIVMAVGILSIFYFFQIPIGYNSLIAGHTAIGFGFCVPLLKLKFDKIDPVLTEASSDLGASYFQTFRKILFPLLLPSMIASAFIVFTLSLDDFFIAFFCSGPGLQTVSTYVYAQIRAIPDPSLNALSTILLLLSSLLVLVFSFTNASKELVGDD